MKYTIKNFNKDFPNDKACLTFLFEQQHPEGSKCETCGKPDSYYLIKDRREYVCSKCGTHVYPTSGTIFHKSDTSLKLWFYAMFLFSVAKNGVSAKELQRQLGVTYKCAWRMAKQIRSIMDEETGKLSGTVEMDEAYVGGKAPQEKRLSNKTMVFGMVERGGRIKAQTVESRSAIDILPIIHEGVEAGSKVYTDDTKALNRKNMAKYNLEKLNHSQKEYARGNAHINTVEAFWSQFKRSVKGTYHFVSKKHLPSYVDEFSFRYNHRFSSPFHALLSRLS